MFPINWLIVLSTICQKKSDCEFSIFLSWSWLCSCLFWPDKTPKIFSFLSQRTLINGDVDRFPIIFYLCSFLPRPLCPLKMVTISPKQINKRVFSASVTQLLYFFQSSTFLSALVGSALQTLTRPQAVLALRWPPWQAPTLRLEALMLRICPTTFYSL